MTSKHTHNTSNQVGRRAPQPVAARGVFKSDNSGAHDPSTEMHDDLYLAIDGDDVGRKLENYAITNNTESLALFSEQYHAAMNWMKNEIISTLSGVVIFSGGDSLMATIPSDTETTIKLTRIKHDFKARSGMSISCGIGTSPRRAYFALKFAKSSGKDRICCFKDLNDG